MKQILSAVCLAVCGAACAVGLPPVVSDVSYVQSSNNKTVAISYELANGPAIVTLDLTTNRTSIGSAYVQNTLSGAVNRVVANGRHTIWWHPLEAWPSNKVESGSVRFAVKAWSTADPPDYMVVNLLADTGGEDRVRYYATTNDLPGGLLDNQVYRKTSLVMRRIRAKGIPWTMGSSVSEHGRQAREDQHIVTMTNDYWISIFPVTQKQFTTVYGAFTFSWKKNAEMRPAETLSLARLRHGSSDTVNWSNHWPNPPGDGSFLKKLNDRTGLSFDLPGDAQWEYACRAGTHDNQWGDGTYYTISTTHSTEDTAANLPGRYQVDGVVWNGSAYAWPSRDTTEPEDGGTPIVGSYAPNRWGLYDMHGGVWEFVLDHPQTDISALTKGEVNANGHWLLDGSGTSDNCIMRGGNCGSNGEWWKARSASRWFSTAANSQTIIFGFRVVCNGDLK